MIILPLKINKDPFPSLSLELPQCGIRLFPAGSDRTAETDLLLECKPPDSTRSLLVEKRVGGENDCLLNNSIAGTMNKTYERPPLVPLQTPTRDWNCGKLVRQALWERMGCD